MAVESSTAGGTGITGGAVYRIADKVPLLSCGDGRQCTTTVASEIITKESLRSCLSLSRFRPNGSNEVVSGPIFESDSGPASNQYLCGDSGARQ